MANITVENIREITVIIPSALRYYTSKSLKYKLGQLAWIGFAKRVVSNLSSSLANRACYEVMTKVILLLNNFNYLSGVAEGYPKNANSRHLIDDGTPYYDDIPPRY